jgi:hypothetical protein
MTPLLLILLPTLIIQVIPNANGFMNKAYYPESYKSSFVLEDGYELVEEEEFLEPMKELAENNIYSQQESDQEDSIYAYKRLDECYCGDIIIIDPNNKQQ